MGKVCTSSCPYYGVDENYNGYCKKDHNSYRERFAPCNMESADASAPSVTPQTTEKSLRTCTSSCPYYGVDENYNGYCKKDHNSYRERFATCNMGETTSGGGAPSAASGGCSGKAIGSLIVLALVIGLGYSFITNRMAGGGRVGTDEQRITTTAADNNTTTTTTVSSIATTTKPQGITMYVVAKNGLRMRSAPNTDGDVLTVIPDKSAVVVIDTQGDWSQVSYDGLTGWCSSEWIFLSIEAGTTTTTTVTTTTTTAAGDDTISRVSEGIRNANAQIEAYRGRLVSGAVTQESLTDDEVMDLFRIAYDRYMDYVWGNITGGFEPVPGPTYENAPIYGSMDGIWRQGVHPDYPDFDTLVRSYYAVFADDLAAYYLRDKIALINAKMYYTSYPSAGDEGVKSTVDYAVEAVAEGYNVKVTANYYRDYDNPDLITDTKYLEFPLRREDGAWVFTKMQWIPN